MSLEQSLARLRKLLSAGELRLGKSFCEQYAGDKWFAVRRPDAVALPRKAKSVGLCFTLQTNTGLL